MSNDKLITHPSPMLLEDYVFQGGNLHCRTCDEEPIWCDHIMDGIVMGLDKSVIWPTHVLANARFRYEPFLLQIPVFPTSNLWETVSLAPTEEYFRYRVGWWPESDNQGVAESTFLMYLNPPESRAVIRDVLLQQLYAKPNFHQMECESSSHNFTAQMTWESGFRNGQTPWPEMWAVFRYKKCLTCLRNQFDPADHPDLFPSKENTGVWK